MKKKVLLTATVQSHICQFHKVLVELLHEHGYEVHVAARDNLAEKNGLKLDFVEKVYDVPFSRSPKSTDNIKAYKQLKKIIEKENYDVVHCNTPMGGIVTRLAARKARKNGTQVYYTAHGFHFYKGAPKKNWVVFYPIEKFFSRMTDKLITINAEDYELAKKKFLCDVYRIHGVGVDENRYSPSTSDEKNKMKIALGYDERQYLILCIGELLPNKNQSMAIHMLKDVIAEFPNTKLLLAGNGPEKEKLRELINQLNLQKNVEFIGYCTCLEKYQTIADIAVSCSLREGLGLNIIEAMLSGNTVIATKNRGHNELLHHGENGYLIDAGDIKNMSEKVKILLNDGILREKMGMAGREFARIYSFEVVREELEKIYEKKYE